VAEWGDRTQIATIALAASHNVLGVTIGAILGHTICALIAVLGGKLIAGRISERTVTIIGGLLFYLFAGVAMINSR
jgi:putative Ca2+/H+ antiporter (TMEM165/GDT1 family)